jgi:hypothetical protein
MVSRAALVMVALTLAGCGAAGTVGSTPTGAISNARPQVI